MITLHSVEATSLKRQLIVAWMESDETHLISALAMTNYFIIIIHNGKQCKENEQHSTNFLFCLLLRDRLSREITEITPYSWYQFMNHYWKQTERATYSEMNWSHYWWGIEIHFRWCCQKSTSLVLWCELEALSENDSCKCCAETCRCLHMSYHITIAITFCRSVQLSTTYPHPTVQAEWSSS